MYTYLFFDIHIPWLVYIYVYTRTMTLHVFIFLKLPLTYDRCGIKIVMPPRNGKTRGLTPKEWAPLGGAHQSTFIRHMNDTYIYYAYIHVYTHNLCKTWCIYSIYVYMYIYFYVYTYIRIYTYISTWIMDLVMQKKTKNVLVSWHILY